MSTDDYTGEQWTADELRRELLDQRDRWRQLDQQIGRLAGWIMTNAPDEIREPGPDEQVPAGADGSAVGIALRLLDEWRTELVKLATGLVELYPDEADPIPDGDPRTGETVADVALRTLRREKDRGDRFGTALLDAHSHITGRMSTGSAEHHARGIITNYDMLRAAVAAEWAKQPRQAAPPDVDITEFGQAGPILTVARRHEPPTDPAADRKARRIRKHLDAAGLHWMHFDPPYEFVSPGVVADMKRIAAIHPAVEYDADDRPEERAAVIVAAVLADLVPVPSTTLTPRSYRGCALPVDEALLDEHADQAAGEATS